MKQLMILSLLLVLFGCQKETQIVNVKELIKIDKVFYRIDKKDRYTGVIEEYSDKDPSILLARASLKEGVLDGPIQGFYTNGQLRFSQQYKKGILDGKNMGYTSEGIPIYERNFKDGKTEGIYRVYYDNGQLKYEENYLNNKVDGESFSYSLEGKLENKKIFKDGVLKEEIDYTDKADNVEFIFRIDGKQSNVTKKTN